MARTYKNPGPIEFTGKILGDEAGSYIKFPYDLKEIFGVGNLVPFKATFDGRVVYRGSLAKMGGPSAMVLLRKDIRAAIGKQRGDDVDVVIELDDAPHEVEIPSDAKRALQEAGLFEGFEKMAFTHRKEYGKWIEEAKKSETRLNRIHKMCSMLAEGKKLS